MSKCLKVILTDFERIGHVSGAETEKFRLPRLDVRVSRYVKYCDNNADH